MKKRNLLFAFFCFLFLNVGQVEILAQCSSSNCTTHNPECTSTTCCSTTNCSTETNNGWAIELLANCSETGTYNCHQYVKAYIYGGKWGNWEPQCGNWAPECPCDHYTGDKFTSAKEFVRVSSSHAATAKTLYYTCDHSAVRVGNNQYVSKNNAAGALYLHTAESYPCTFQYWEYVGTISPNNSNYTLDSPTNFSIADRPGVSYEWCASPSNKVSFSCTSCHNPVISPASSGNTTIKVIITGSNGSTKTQCKTVTVESQNSAFCNITGTVQTNGQTNTLYTYNGIYSYSSTVNLTCSETAYFTWTKTGGSGSYYIPYPRKKAYLYLNSGQSLAFDIKAYTSNGTLLGSRSCVFTRSSWGGGGWLIDPDTGVIQEDKTFSTTEETVTPDGPGIKDYEPIAVYRAQLYPNPASDLLNINLTENTLSEVALIDSYGKFILIESAANASRQHLLDVSQLPAGIYYIQLTDTMGHRALHKVMITK